MEYNSYNDRLYISKSFVFFAILLWILIGFGYGSADFFSYENYYERIASGYEVMAVEPGYVLLNYLASKVGFNYIGFQVIYSLVAFLFIGITIQKYAARPNLILFAYFCYPFLLDATQLRHFMVSAIVLYAIKYLENYSLNNIFKYCVCILIASTQQITGFIYLLLLLVYIPSITILKRICIIGSLALVFFVKAIPKTKVFLTIIGLRDVEKIYEKGMSGNQLFLYLFFFLLLIFLCVKLRKITTYYVIENDMFYKICYISLLFIPFMLLDFQYTRFFRGIIILIYIYLTNILVLLDNIQNRIMSMFLFMFMMISVGYKLFGPDSGYFTYLTHPILSKNYIINLLF